MAGYPQSLDSDFDWERDGREEFFDLKKRWEGGALYNFFLKVRMGGREETRNSEKGGREESLDKEKGWREESLDKEKDLREESLYWEKGWKEKSLV